jgi:hypothetical protein
MSTDRSKISAPLWAYREPPNGLTDQWQRVYRALVDPITMVLTFQPGHARQGTDTLFAAWHDALRRSGDAASAVLPFLHGPSQRTWRVGHAILNAIAPITAALCSTIRFLNNPTPTPKGQEGTANDLRVNIAEKLSGFDALPLLDELAAAVVADCVMQRAQPAHANASVAQPSVGESPAAAGADQQQTGLATHATDPETLAIALLFQRPHLSLPEIAAAVRVERQTLYKWPTFLQAAEKVGKYTPKRSKGGNLPSGSKTAEGTVEAWRDSEEVNE